MINHSIPFDQLLLSLVPSLRAYARSLCRDPNLADDIVQDALLVAWTKRNTLRDLGAIKPWLLTIVRNTYFAYVRRGKKEVEDVDGIHAGRQTVPAPQETASELSDVKQAINALSDEEREALVLVCIDNLTYQEAALICACPVGTIKSRLNRARLQVISHLTDAPSLLTARNEKKSTSQGSMSLGQKPKKKAKPRAAWFEKDEVRPKRAIA